MERIKKPALRIADLFRRYVVVICFVIVGSVYGYLVFTSSSQTAQSPSDTEIEERLKSTKRTNIDDSAAKALQELQDQNIEINLLFEEARNNPFSE